jgi:hypothetical protein
MRNLSVEEAIGRRESGRLAVSMLVGVLAAVACLLAAPSLARAGTFTALSCHDAAGSGIGRRGWTEGTSSGEYITFGESCANGGAGSFGLTMGPDPRGNYVNGNGNTMKYSVPAGLAILSYSLQLEAYSGPCSVQGNQCANGMGDVYVNHTGESDPTYDYRNLGKGAATTTVGAGELSGVNWVVFGVSCDSEPNHECPGSNSAGFEAQALVSSGSFTLLDSTVPTVANVTGSLLAAGMLTGEDTVNFTASDSGGGIYSATVLVDGHQVIQKVPDTNGGLCVNLAPASSATMAFAASQPCPITENVSLTVNTSAISAGQHHLQVLVTDAAGDQAVAYDGTIIVGGTSSSGSSASAGAGQICSGSTAAASSASATNQAKLTARWVNTSKATLTIRYGARERVTGRLMTPSGQAISGVPIDVCEIPAYEGGMPVDVASVRTGTTGEWTLTLPKDISSSSLRFVYPSPASDMTPVATTTLTLRVHAGIELRIAPHISSVGHRIFFSGTLHGAPIPPGGKQLELEASSGGGWIQFDTLTTNSKGRYRASYRFKFPGPITYKFRVVSPYQSNFPFLSGTSNNIAVYER